MFRRRHPEVQVEMVVSNRASSLHRRDADLALRMFRPKQEDLVARRLPDLELGFFCHRDLLGPGEAARGMEVLHRHPVIGFDRDTQFLEAARALGIPLSPHDFDLRCDSILAQTQMVRAGLGAGVVHVGIARRYPELVRVMRQLPIPALELWLVCHRDVRHNRRIRALMDHLAWWLGEDPYEGPAAGEGAANIPIPAG
jgi:DNA-binding transcriptional LysR family regulator